MIFYTQDVYFKWSKQKIQQKIEQQYFQTRGAYYTRKYGYFNILRVKVGVRIIRGCVLYAENYGNRFITTVSLSTAFFMDTVTGFCLIIDVFIDIIMFNIVFPDYIILMPQLTNTEHNLQRSRYQIVRVKMLCKYLFLPPIQYRYRLIL